MENELKVRSELAAGIRAGVPLGEFVPFYEKQIDLASGDLVGFEMLARWKSPTLGLVGPEVFIPVAEEIGMIGALSESVISQALRDARHWNPKLSLSVNISPIQLRDPWFAQKLLRMLVEANFPPSRLEIEVTESCLHEDLGLVRSLISSLKNQGIKISLDDFGTLFRTSAAALKVTRLSRRSPRSGAGSGCRSPPRGSNAPKCSRGYGSLASSRVRAIFMACRNRRA
jgi:EAL domain-containing protein (putative c-di-GMP-specific phosphodiesterase class I)